MALSNDTNLVIDMTFLAHWKCDEGSGIEATVAIDSEGNGSGSHNGTYGYSTTSDNYGSLSSGGVGGKHLHTTRNASGYGGAIININNPADFRLVGTFTAMFWFCDDYYRVITYGRYFIGCTGAEDTTIAENDLWQVRHASHRAIAVYWETSPGVRTTVTSVTGICKKNGWDHFAVVRYEVTAGMWGIKFYVNGVLADTQDNTGAGWSPPTGGTNSLPYVCRNGGSINNDESEIDSIRVYDTEENAATILAVYDAEKQYFEGLGVDDTIELGMVRSLPDEAEYQVIDTGPNSDRINAGFSTV